MGLPVATGTAAIATPNLPLTGLSSPAAKGIGIVPVAHEHRIARLEHAARVLFLVVQDALGRDVPNPAEASSQRLGCLRIVDLDRTVKLDDATATKGMDPFLRVAGQPFIGGALEDEIRTCRNCRLARSASMMRSAAVSVRLLARYSGTASPCFSSRSDR